MTKEEKLEIDRLVSIYLNGLMSVSNDAGWEGMGLLDRLITFKGQPPPPTGNDQSNLSMIIAVRLLREQHKEFPLIAAAMRVLQKRHWDQAIALCARNYYLGFCAWTGKTYTDEARASEINMDMNLYRYNLQKGYFSLQSELEVARMYRQMFDAA
ncbi:MAG: hypothetical protein CMQ46_05670 [Gammaproteobacteria bacterium]|nr:hypothetical protein [Gammaproteobacteria bacterium]MBJ54733.1 hypothetical protein [Gammaproteobacteria bacterium]HBN15753.1 hypothetical protein [Pseudohongiella sp.]|tara:strand:+ start:293 stop:757 length:465 start_codon:yes stop_codon:yes gene_type:complete